MIPTSDSDSFSPGAADERSPPVVPPRRPPAQPPLPRQLQDAAPTPSVTAAEKADPGSKPTRQRPLTPPQKVARQSDAAKQPKQARQFTAMPTIDTTAALATAADGSLVDRLDRNRSSISGVLWSTILHAVCLLLLFVCTAWQPPLSRPISLTAEIVSQPVDSEIELLDPSVVITDVVKASPVEEVAEEIVDDVETAAAEDLNVAIPEIDISPVAPAPDAVAENQVPQPQANRGGSLEGRNAKSRAALAAARGGTPESEQAVERGLRWIVEHQNRYDGNWDFFNHCRQCRHSGRSSSKAAATGLSLMALLGAGYTHQTGPYQDAVQAGLDFLVNEQKKRVTEFGGSFIDDNAGMYVHAMATTAVAEAYVMSGDEQLKPALKLAHQYILSAQNRQGGWRYKPNQPGDMLVTGWQIIALKSLERADIKTPAEVYDRARAFIDSLADGSAFKYQSRERRDSPTATAVGLLSQMYLGWEKENSQLQRGALYLSDARFSRTDIYFNFYATLLLHHLNNELFPHWNEKMRDFLVDSQSRRGHEKGSWHFKDRHGDVGGRLYSTAMAVMILEVYYRYSPLFSVDPTNNSATSSAP